METIRNNTIYHPRVFVEVLKFLSLFLVITVPVIFASPASAQVLPFSQADIGTTGVSGTYNYSSGVYTVGGGGAGISGTADNFCYASATTSGNIEMIARVNTQTNTNPYATSGLMMRASTNANSINAYISVSPSNGVNFSSRATNGGNTTTVYGPTIAAPTYIRLVRSGNNFSGYQSTDGINWTLVGTTTLSNMPNSFLVGFGVSSNVSGTLSTATFDKVSFMSSVPQRSANLMMWLRSDVGVTTSSGAVTNWADQSGNGYNATQTSGSARPTLTTNAVNGLPAITFNGSSHFLNLPAGFKDLSQGLSFYIVYKPGTTANYPIDIGNGGASNDQSIYGSANFIYYYSYGTSYALVTSNSSGYTPNVYQVLEVVHNGTNNATIYKNGTQTGTGTVYPLNTITRSTNRIGQYGGGSYFYSSDIAEIIVMNKGTTAAERAAIESYYFSKYAVGSQPTLSAPVITPNNTVVATSPQTVTITGDAGANLFYTTNGSTPTSGSTPYTAPFTISSTTTVKAIAIKQFYTDSPVSTSIIQIDPTTAGISRTGLMLWLKSDLGVQTSSSSVTDWADLSGNSMNATQVTSGARPTINSSAIAGLPSVVFNGSSQYMNLPTGFANLTSGASLFVVKKTTATPGGHKAIFDIGAGANDHFTLYDYPTTTEQLWAYSGASQGSISSTSGFTLNQFQLIEGIHSGAGSGSIYTNGVLGVTGSLYNLSNVSRTSNGIGTYTYNYGNLVQGEICEILFYSRPVTSQERQAIEQYVNNRYQFSVKPPVITPASGVYSILPATATMSADPGATIYFTSDGSQPTTGSTQYTTPIALSGSAVLRAIAVTGWGTSSTTDAYIQLKQGTENVPRTGMQLWYKSDYGVLTTGGSNVTQWSDMSGNGFHATQSNGTNRPTLTNDLVNDYPALSFNGTAHFLQMPAGFADFTSGASIFAVTRPTGFPSSTPVIMDFSNGAANSNNLTVLEGTSTTIGFNAYNASTSSSVNSTSGLTQGKFQMFEIIHNGAANGTVYTNTTQGATGTVQNLVNIARSTNYVGRSGGGTPLYFQGDLAEIFMYNRGLSSSERAGVESYLMQKYQLGNAAPIAPIFSISTSTLAEASQVAITAEPTSTIHITLDGSTPTTSSPVYDKPVNISFTQTLKAIAVYQGVSSSVTSATYTLNSTKWPAPHATDTTPLHLNLQLPTTAIPQ